MRAEWSVRAHYAVLRLVLVTVVGSARLLFGLRVVDDEVGWSPLDDGVHGSENAMLVLSRHAGPGDSLLLVHTLLGRDHDRRPRIVLKDLLQLDPLVDVYLNRLPNAFLEAGADDSAARVGRLAERLGDEDALLIFPEGELTVGGPLKPFKAGAGLIAVEGATPVVPMKVKIKRLSWIDGRGPGTSPRGDVEVIFGPPIHFAAGTDAAVATAELQAAVDAL